ncbi:unnamed protein product [Gulo gulo]|uniref:Uncharacterized protein n=1 Tax=Gulo gulo TaxID=48420 RepID=A0A9X9MAN4_GULGU|nr:unnamed protein product [Gulo gulo]
MVIKVPAFIGLFQDFCASVVTSHTIMELGEGPSVGTKFMMRILSRSTRVWASCPWQMLDATQTVSSFSFARPGRSSWLVGMWSLAK